MDAAIARFAARQQGLFLRSQALTAGATGSMIETRLATGRWVLVGRGVYRLAGVPVTWKQRALAACLTSGAGAVVSHRSAAVLWGVSGFRPGPLDITVPPGRSGRNGLARVHRSVEVAGMRRDGVPVTRPSRTVLDLAGVVGGDVLEEAVDDVLCRRLCRLDELVVPAGRRGSAALRAVLEAWHGDALPDGVAEMRVVRALLAAGLDQPVRPVRDPPRRRVRGPGGPCLPGVPAGDRARRVPVARRPAPVPEQPAAAEPVEAAGWRLLEAAPEDIAELVRDAAAIVRRAA